MVWQDAVSSGPGGPAFDAERERERRLAAQARAGAEWALTALIARYQPTVVRYLTRLCGNPAQARTLAERIFQRMERRLHGPHGAENLRLWLLRSSTEAGLDALRRPQRAPAVRLGAGRVAGLLTRQTGQETQGGLQGGLRRLRQAHGSASQQARPLIWADDAPKAATTAAHPSEAAAAQTHAAADGHLDEELDRLDPRDALRHRLVRLTLAELPYGDAQCLALHLVAGLNQAEVARALGLTNSAARKRIVHGLTQFAGRYSQAVQSLNLPVELGFGDALPRPAFEPEPVAEPTPAPVIVSSQPPSAEAPESVEPRAPGADRIVEDPARVAAAAEAAGLASVAYLSDETGETPMMPPAAPPDSFYANARHRHAGYTAYEPTAVYKSDGDVFDLASETTLQGSRPVAIAVDDPRDNPRDNPRDDAIGALVAAPTTTPLASPEHLGQPGDFSPGPVSGGLITRLAADAIIGPIVDALPVSPAPLQEPIGLMGPRSMPLAYELNTSAAGEAGSESSSVMMNWLDDNGLMTPLSFESLAVTSDVSSRAEAPVESAPLSFESVAITTDELAPLTFLTSQAPSATEGASLGYEAVALTASVSNYASAHETGAALEYELAPTPAIEHAAATLTAPPATPIEAHNSVAGPLEQAPDRRSTGAYTARSLEDLWDELPE